jgi:hypothetical protein
MSRRALVVLATGSSLLAALLLRLWGIAFGPWSPHARPDEETFIVHAFDMNSGDQAVELLHSGWPQGYFRIVHLLEAIETRVLELVWHHPVHLACLYAVNGLSVQIWPRVFSALADVVGCLFVGLTVRRLAPKEARDFALPCGVLALGCNYLAARDAHFGVSDATLLSSICIGTYASVRAVMDGPRYLPLLAVATGVGFGVKYAAAPMGASCILAVAFCLVRFTKRRRATLGLTLLSMIAGLLAFELMSPGGLTHFPDLWRSIVGHSERYTDQARAYLLDSGFTIGPGWMFHLFHNLPTAFGWPGFILSLAGLGLCVRRDRYAGALLVASALVSFAMLFAIRTQFVRYAGPVLPPLAVGLGLVLTLASSGIRAWLPSSAAGLAIALLLLVTFALPLRLILQFDHLLSAPDTRDQAAVWLVKQHAPAITTGQFSTVQLLDPGMADACKPMVPPFLWREVPKMPPISPDWPVFVGAGQGFWGAISHNALENCLYNSPPREKSAFVVSGQGVLPCNRMGREDESPPLDPQCFEIATVFSPGSPECGGYLDMFDSMWIPYWGFGGWEHPGPRIEIYRNKCFREEQTAD